MSEGYITAHFDDIRTHARNVEDRQADEGLTPETLIADNARFLAGCQAHGWPYLLIDGAYEIEFAAEKLFF